MLQIVDKLFALYGVEKDYFLGGKNRGLNNGGNGEKTISCRIFQELPDKGRFADLLYSDVVYQCVR